MPEQFKESALSIPMTKTQQKQMKKLLKKGIYGQLHQQGLLTEEQRNQLFDRIMESQG